MTDSRYTMRISRLTVDKLGIKMYDKVSAALAELVANAYDADATVVKITAPMGKFLATQDGDGQLIDKKHLITVEDNGCGMTPDEINDFYLKVGGERRNDRKRPENFRDTTPNGRKVMGRKGVGKLAPFGICEKIEIISSGGEPIMDEDGTKKFLTAHLILDRNAIMDDIDEDYHPEPGSEDGTYKSKTGTRIVLSQFAKRKVPEIDLLIRELAQRFGVSREDWNVTLEDSESKCVKAVGSFEIEKLPDTVIQFECMLNADGVKLCQPTLVEVDEVDYKYGFVLENIYYPVTGWVAYSPTPFKDDLMAGIRIYCRGKIAAQTSLFNRKAGFTGEHDIRSYAIGELNADWLDEEDDLILTDRRNILWSDPVCQAFEAWGQGVIKKLGGLSREPMRKKALDLFKEKTEWGRTLEESFPGEEKAGIREKANELVKIWAGRMRTEEIQDQEQVNSIANLLIMFAPHLELNKKLRDAADEAECTLGVIASVLKTAKIAELTSFGHIAQKRLDVISRLKAIQENDASQEQEMQDLITEAPWIVNPQWAPISANKTFKSFTELFQKFFKEKTGNDVMIKPFLHQTKRADFVMADFDGQIQIVEIKKVSHIFNDEDFDRLYNYYENMTNFINDPAHKDITKSYSIFHITLICREEINLTSKNRDIFNSWHEKKILTHRSWISVLQSAKHSHEEFLEAARSAERNGES